MIPKNKMQTKLVIVHLDDPVFAYIKLRYMYIINPGGKFLSSYQNVSGKQPARDFWWMQ